MSTSLKKTNASLVQQKARREKLQQGIVSKLKDMCSKHGIQALSRQELDFANGEVAKLLASGKVQEADLTRLEKAIRDKRKPSGTKLSQTQKSDIEGTGAQQQSPGSQAPSEAMFSDEWAALQALEREEFEERARREREAERAKRENVRKALDLQTRAQKDTQSRAKKEDYEYARLEAERLKVWREQERKKEEQIRQKNLREKEIRDRQLEEMKEKKMQEERERQEEEARNMEMAHQRLVADRDRELERRRLEKSEYTRVLADNERLKDLKKTMKKRQIEEDIEYQRKYNELQDELERQRQQNLKELAEKQRRKYEIGMKVLKTIDQKANEDQLRAEREQALRDQAAREEDDRRQAKVKSEREAMKAVLARQLKEKDELRKKQEREMKEYADLVHREAVEHEHREIEKRQAMRKHTAGHRGELEQQIRDNALRRQYETYVMTDVERQLNAHLLKRAAEKTQTLQPQQRSTSRLSATVASMSAPW